MKRKLIASLLCLCMLVSLLPAAAFATSTETQPEGLENYKVIAAGVSTTLPGGFPTKNAGSAVSETNANRIYVQLNKPVPDGYTIALTVYPDGKTEGAYLSTFVAGNSPEGICVTVQKLNAWYWGNESENAKLTDFSAFGNPTKLNFHVSIVPYEEGKVPAYTDDGTGHYVFTPVNSITQEGSKTTSEAIPVTIATPISNPVIWAGLSANATDMIADIKTATGMTATVDSEDAENLLWFAMKGLDAGKYTLSMKGSGLDGKEVLNKNSIAYGSQDGKFDVAPAGKHLIYVSLDEFSADGTTGQGSLAALGNGGTFNVSVTKENGQTAAATSTIDLVKITLEAGEGVTLPTGTKAELYAVKGDKVTLPTATKEGQEFQGWAVGTETPVTEYTATASATLKPVFGAPVVKTPELSRAGFDMDATKAHTAINAALAAVRPGGTVDSSDVDTNTMFVAVDNLDSTKTYELAVTNKAGTEIYAEKNLTGKTETVVYFTFNSNGGSHTTTAIAADTYSFQLYEMVKAEGADTATRTAVGAPVSLELVKATLKAEDATTSFTPVDLYAAKGGTVTITATDPVRTNYTFKGWNDGTQTVVKGGELTLSANVELTPVWQSDAVTTAAADVKVDAIKDDGAKVALAKTTAVSDNLMLDPAVQTQAEAVAKTITNDMLTQEEVTAGTTVKAAVYLEVVPQEYTKASDDTLPVLKLDITPKVKLVKISSDGKTVTDITSKDAVALTSKTYSKPVTINVVLPADFGVAAGNQNVYAMHMSGTTILEYIKATVTASNQSDLTASFEATSFSPYVLTVDNRSVTVTFGEGGSAVSLTPEKIGMKTTDLSIADPTPAEGKVFSGWGTGSTVIWAKDAALTDDILDALIKASTDDNGTKKITLTAIFTDASKPSTPGSSGGGVSSNVTIDRPTNGKVTVTPTAPSKGATVTINLTPDTGYQVGTVTVTDKDGKAIELTKVSDTKYTFTMPEGKVKVAATFTKVAAEGFTDVAADAYYADAVKWAVDKGITNGLTATTFGPNNSCTRGQMVTFLWRAAGSPAATGTNSFSDVASGEYYYNAVLWAVEKGITNGTSATTFSPNATVNRGQTVTFLYRYAESPAATGDSTFTDVAADAYYADAVKWAVAEEITNGTSATTFAPASNCTRGQIVTFLYRQMAE